MNTETKGKPIGKILLIFFLVLAFTGIGILLQVFVRQSTDLTAKKDSESEIQKQIENKNKEIAGLEKEKEKLNSKLQEQQKKAAEEEESPYTAFPYTVILNTAFSLASHKSHTPLCPSDRCSHAAGSFPDTQDAPALSEP